MATSSLPSRLGAFNLSRFSLRESPTLPSRSQPARQAAPLEAGALPSLCSHEEPRRRGQDPAVQKKYKSQVPRWQEDLPESFFIPGCPGGVLPLPAPQSLLFFLLCSRPVRHGVCPRPEFFLLPVVPPAGFAARLRRPALRPSLRLPVCTEGRRHERPGWPCSVQLRSSAFSTERVHSPAPA